MSFAGWQGVDRVLRPGSLAATTVALFAPGLVVGPPFDSAVYVLAGSRIREGFMPYRDVVDNKPPGVYLLNALGQMALPWLDAWLISWLLTVVFTGAAVLLVYDLLRRRHSPWVAWAWSLLCCAAIACHPVAAGGGLTESFAVLPLVGALWIVAVLSRSRRNLAAIGCALSFACLLSLQCLPAAGALAAVAVWTGEGAFAWPRRAVALVAGGVPLSLAVLGWLVTGGALGEALDQIGPYNEAYRASGSQLLLMLPLLILLLGWLAIPAGVGVWRLIRRPRGFGPLDWACAIWSATYAIFLAWQSRIFLHYLILLIPPLIVLASQGMAAIWAQLRAPNRKLRGLAVGLTSAAAVVLLISASVTVELSGMTLQRAGDAKLVDDATAAWIRANTPGSATMFIWGNDPEQYLAANRAPYGRYVNQFPMVTVGYWSADRTAAVLASWQASPPALIVEGPAQVPMFRPPTDIGGVGYLDLLGPLRDFARAHYRLVASFGDGDNFDDVYAYVPSS